MTALMNWLKEFIHNIVQSIITFFIWLIDLLKDIFLWLIDGLLTALVSLIKLVPVPDAVSHGLNSYFASMSPLTLYALSHTGFPTALAIIGTAYAFRLLRKFATLFQW